MSELPGFDPRLTEILHTLKTEAEGPVERPNLETARQELYSAYDKTRETIPFHDEALPLVQEEQNAYRAAQVQEAKDFVTDSEGIIAAGLQEIDPKLRGILEVMIPQLVIPSENEEMYSNRNGIGILSVIANKTEGNSAVQTMYDATRKFVQRTADGTVHGPKELVGLTVEQARANNAPLVGYLHPDAVINHVNAVGFSPNKMIEDKYSLSAPKVFASVEVTKPTSPSTP